MDYYEFVNGNTNKGQPSYICSTTDFVQATDAPDGSSLVVVDETSHAVSSYYIAFNGYWCSL